nr:hypothetical protein K4M20_00361 [Agrobacterium fabrum]
MTQALNEELAIGIEHDLDHHRIIKRDAKLIAEGVLEFAYQTRMGAQLGHAALLIAATPIRGIE